MSWFKWSTLVIYVGFQKLDGSDLKGLVLAETIIFLEVGLDMSVSKSKLGGMKNRV